MERHLERELDDIKRQILTMGTMVEEAINNSIVALKHTDKNLADQVIADDSKVNDLENKIEEDCLKTLALYQPVAVDLRFITAVMKINNDLERMGDSAVNIAERIVYLTNVPLRLAAIFNFKEMAAQVQQMVRESLDSLVHKNSALARKVCGEDDIVDNQNRSMFELAKEEVQKDPSQVEIILHLLSISRHLERIADLATNLAEDVVYLVEGEIIRHMAETDKVRAVKV
ncbi:MAG: phosphate signaling complex protein PhoU [Candidatus Schekmanbacteria bacterium]|nr:phosphate signaling complex protein PhoU [Candidatus Schekmanbacteria bacterium]